MLLTAMLSAGCSDNASARPSGTATAAPESSVNVPLFSSHGGLYAGSVSVSLSLPENAPSGAYITYTLNGDEPKAGSAKYVSPLEIDATSVIRAALFSAFGKQLGNVKTNTYILSGSTGLMTVALTADNNDLYSSGSGILANRSGTGSEWERPACVEIYAPDGREILHQDAGIRLSGSGSRSFDPASFRLVARRSEYLDESGVKYGGSGKFRADLFGTGFEEYDRFLLRNGGNDSPYQARANFLRMDLLRDCIANEYVAGFQERAEVSVFAQRSVPVRVYLNGEYYGMSVMKEDLDERLLSERYGFEKENVTVIKGKKLYYQVESGGQTELDRWLELCQYAIDNALSADRSKAYEYVAERIDTDNAAAYLAVMLYLCNTDWPQNNAMVWRYTGAASGSEYSDGKWRFVIRDMDLCFALHDEPSRVSRTTYSMADTDTFYRLLVFYRRGSGYEYDASTGLYGDDMKLQGLFDFLLRSEGFRDRFKYYCGLLCSEGEAKHMAETAASFRSLAAGEMKRHIEYWKSKGKIYSAYDYSCWERSFEDVAGFIDERAGYFRQYMDETLAFYE
jgi:hypothetical protein